MKLFFSWCICQGEFDGTMIFIGKDIAPVYIGLSLQTSHTLADITNDTSISHLIRRAQGHVIYSTSNTTGSSESFDTETPWLSSSFIKASKSSFKPITFTTDTYTYFSY